MVKYENSTQNTISRTLSSFTANLGANEIFKCENSRVSLKPCLIYNKLDFYVRSLETNDIN